jgi:hypothetical protein
VTPLAAVFALVGASSVVNAQASLDRRATVNAKSVAGSGRSHVIVFRVATSDRDDKALASALDSVLVAAISERKQVVSQHALDLPSTQLALDCMAETPACLQAVMQQPGVDAQVLLAPTLERSGSELVLSLLYFDASNGDALRHATRRHSGEQAQRRLLNAVPSMVQELFGRRAASATSVRAAPAAASRPERADSERSAWPVVPIALTSAGVAFLGAGVVFGLSARAAEEEYAAARTGTAAERKAADETFDRAQTHATLATVGIAAGASAITAGIGLWLFGSDRVSEQPSARLLPRLTRGGAGVVLESRFMEPQP